MGRTTQNGRGTSAARLLGLLAVLLGLLAMHGLVSTHHAAAAVPAPAAVAHPEGPRSSHGHAGHGRAASSAASPAYDLHVTGGAAQTAAALPGPACAGDCRPVAAVLCLAVVVTASAVAVLAVVARRRAGLHLPARPRVCGPPAHTHPPPATPDPVKDLCVSRT